MKQFLKMGLCFAVISPLSTVASPLAFPAPHQWHFTVGAETGVDSYQGKANCHSFNSNYVGSTYSLGLNQSVGYGAWFYIQAKESGSTNLTGQEYDHDHTGFTHRPRVAFFDADIRAYFPLALSQTYKVSLQPQIGFAVHTLAMRFKDDDNNYTAYKTKAFAPLMGLALGCDVSSNFNFRFGIAFEILNSHAASRTGFTALTSDWVRLKAHRLAVHSTLDMSYKVGRMVDLTGSVDHLNYSPTQPADSDGSDDVSYLNRLSYKIGARWNF